MKAIGIIAEYNPFHNGHLYHLNKIKEMYPDYSIILVMNGNFTERGEVTLIDKWKRTDIALELGIDLVIELPFPFSTQSADFYAYGAITILEKLQVEKVIFGSESDNIEDLKLIAETQINNDEFDKLVKIYCKLGNNYPTALSKALEDLTDKKITTPNDLLGISYIKTILENKYKIIPETIKRTNNYHNKELTNTFSSATSIRESLKQDISIKDQVPINTLKRLDNLHYMDMYFNILKYKIITEDNLEIYQTVETGMNNKLKEVITKVNTYDELIKSLKSKKDTYNKISRMLLHILCNFTKEEAKSYNKITYIRVLGFNKTGKNYLNNIKKQLDVPIISKITREKDPMLEFELNTTKIYDLIYNEGLFKKEYQNHLYKEDL
ncbi:MAG: nucleotidyltransferase [Bacilli bacterium]|nr:nucleotidyltransferase [Bacilli bacterium]